MKELSTTQLQYIGYAMSRKSTLARTLLGAVGITNVRVKAYLYSIGENTIKFRVEYGEADTFMQSGLCETVHYEIEASELVKNLVPEEKIDAPT